MTNSTDDYIEPSHVQFGDFEGTAAADGHHGPALRELAAMVGLDESRYDIVGFEFGLKLLRGQPGLVIFAVDREVLGDLTLAQYGTRHGEMPVVDFLVHSTPASDMLAAGLKRLKVQLLSRELPDGVPLRRARRDDLGLSNSGT